MSGDPRDIPVTDAWPPTSVHVHTRTLRGLQRDGIATLGEVTSRWAHDLLDIHAFGTACLAEVRRVLASHGLALRGDDEGTTP